MRKTFVKTIMGYADNPKLVFLTGDLGYKALEPLRDKMKERFINAGIAEQNMLTVAAGLAAMGDRPWVYSIAPFLYARAFEQISNDICKPNRPVMMVGNGAGYQYGVMGPSHHALNDYGVLLTNPFIRCLIPAFASDIPTMVADMMTTDKPCYLRLGVAEEPLGYEPPLSRQVHVTDKGPVVVIVGSIAGSLIEPLQGLASTWVVNELPSVVQTRFIDVLGRTRNLIVIEEHAPQGGLGDAICGALVRAGIDMSRRQYEHRYAKGYVSGKYGSKEFHRAESGLDKDSIVELVKRMS